MSDQTQSPKLTRGQFTVRVLIVAAIILAVFIIFVAIVNPFKPATEENLAISQGGSQVETLRTPVAYINEATGKITKYIDEYGGDTFEEGYTSSDTKVEVAYGWSSGSDSIVIDGSVEVNGVSYPRTSTLNWSIDSVNAELVKFFNEKIAGPDYNTVAMLKEWAISFLIADYVSDTVRATFQETDVPAVHYTVSGKSVVEGNSKVVDGWLNKTPAWQVYREVNGTTSTDERFYYSFFCASYEVQGDGSALTEFARQLFASKIFQVNIVYDTDPLDLETEVPCEVKYDYPNGYPEPTPTEDGGYTS